MDCCFCFLKGAKTRAIRSVSGHHGYNLKYVPKRFQNDREVVLEACSNFGPALFYASDRLKNDKKVVLVACSNNFGTSLEHASQQLKNDKEVVVTAISQSGIAIKWASKELQNDKETLLLACSKNAEALKFASEELQKDKDFVRAICSKRGEALQHAFDEFKNDKEVVLAACSQCGGALNYASESLRADKEVVMAAIESEPMAIKFALGRLNQDKDCLIKAGVWDEDYDTMEQKIKKTDRGNSSRTINHKKKIVLSTKFSLAAESSEHATKFTLMLKNHPYIRKGGFVVYSPNAYNKGTCDPNWTDEKWPCRGTHDSCQKPHHLKVGVPQESESCWRYSFRYQLEAAHGGGGFMIQVVDCNWDETKYKGKHVLGHGQKIETDMAKDVGIKIFRYWEPHRLWSDEEVKILVSKIENWFKDDCNDMSECNVKTMYYSTSTTVEFGNS